MTKSKTLIIGLGNNGDDFSFSPHNIGHHIVDNIAIDQSLASMHQVNIIRNNSFMNNAGLSLKRYLVNQNKIKLIVICDDIDLSFGLMRIRYGHSDGGHNGLKSINSIWKEKYWLIKIGFCPDIELDQDSYNLRRHNSSKYVLKKFKNSHKLQYEQIIISASQLISDMIKIGDLRNQTIDLLGEDKCL